MAATPTYLVTGALGCIGAWCAYHLVQAGTPVVSFDLSQDRHRLDLLLSPAEQAAITFVTGDLTDGGAVRQAVEAHGITHIIHLAALQVPFCKARPALGAQVNVTGTVNVFEAARSAGLPHVVYASSVAVYGPPALYPDGPLPHDAAMAPQTLYGVYKQADEGLARVYWADYEVASTALRPYTVYGVGRDQGLTSDPTRAMLAVAAGRPFHIAFGGTTQLQWASDVAQQFIEAALHPQPGAYGFNLGGETVALDALARLIAAARPGGQVTVGDTLLPFPHRLDDRTLRRHYAQVYETPLRDGIEQTIAHFEACLQANRLTPPH